MLFHAKFAYCKIDVVPLLTNIWLAVKAAAPVPPLEIDNGPADTFEAFKFVGKAPEPEKVDINTHVADIDVPVIKGPGNIPPVKGKNNDNVEEMGVPFLYISAQLILFNTS